MSRPSFSSPAAISSSKRQYYPSRDPFACDTVDFGTWNVEGTDYISHYNGPAETTHSTAPGSAYKMNGTSPEPPAAVRQANDQVLRRLNDLKLKRNELVERRDVEDLKKVEELLERCIDL